MESGDSEIQLIPQKLIPQKKDKGKQRKVESSGEEELEDQGDTIMASPPRVSGPSDVTGEAEDTVMASPPHHGSSRST